MKWEPVECRSGDMVRICLGALYHYGIFVSEDEVIQFGLPPTAENRAAEGEVKVLATDIDVFACGCIVETAVLDKSEEKRRVPRAETVARARKRLGEGGYNIIHNNCEHFVNECVFGEARCTQEEDVRRRWLNRPICDVYLMKITADAEGEIFPEKRRREIENIRDEAQRNEACCLWLLLQHAAKRTFGTEPGDAGFKRKLGGRWVSDKFRFSLAAQNGVAAVAVSNAEVELTLGDADAPKTLRDPRLGVTVRSKNSSAAKYFWTEHGSSVLMGGKFFE